MIAILCAVLGAAGFALGHGTADAWLLAWLAPIPILWLAFGQARGWQVGLAAFAAFAVGQLGYLWPYLEVMGAAVVIAAAPGALAFTVAVLLARFAARRLPAAAALFVFPGLWTAWEALSAMASPHGSIGAWAYSQVSVPAVIQSASLFGLWAVSFLIALVAAGAALSLRRRNPVPVAIACAVLAANLAFGAWRLAQPQGPVLKVAAAARDYDAKLTPVQVAAGQAVVARRLAGQGVNTIVFQEKAALLPAPGRDAALAPLVAASGATGMRIVTGFDQTGSQRRNAAYAITPDGKVAVYTKRHHIPGLETGYTPGEGPGLLGGGLAMAICKDFDFQATLRRDAAAGAAADGLGGGTRMMFAPAWDFDTDGWLHGRMAVMRGVEGGYGLVRAAADGLLTVTDAQGRVLATGPSGKGAYRWVVADLPQGPGPTLYVRIGDLFAWLAGALGLGLVVWAGVRKFTRARPTD